MKYKVNHKNRDLGEALGLEKSQKTRIDNAISKAIDKTYGNSAQDFSIDEINELVAPYIRTAEEAFYAGQSIGVVILAAAHEIGAMPKPNRIN